MKNSKATLVRFLTTKGEWKQELCHDVSICREHAAKIISTNKILKLKPQLADFDFDEIEEEDVMGVFSESSSNITKDAKLTALRGLLAPNSSASYSINNKIKAWKTIMPKLRPKGTALEQLIENSLNEQGIETGWDPESHKVSEDMEMILDGDPTSVSIKTGVWDDKNSMLTISGSRTGEHKTIEDKLSHLKGTSAEVYLLLSGKKGAKPEDPYYLITFRHEAIPFGEPSDWTETPNKWFYETETARLEIRKSMSDQFWIVLKDRDLLTVELLDI